MTSLPASLGITTPESAGKVPGSYGWGAGKERLKLDRAQLLQCSQGLGRHSGGGKGPKTTLSWSCFVSAATVVLKGLCGQDFRELAQESHGLFSKPVLLRGGVKRHLPLGFHNQI